jgi:stearoyl-CoA desaturase (delta-9 desaturase)
MFGKRDFGDDRRVAEPAWLALPTLGEAWHNSHHAFSTSAVHG